MSLSPENIQLLERAWLVQQRSREVHPGTNRDLKVIEECAEFGEAAMRLTHALSRRLSGYANGGARGKVDEELADAFFAAMKLLTPDSAAWVFLAQKVERFEALVSGSPQREPQRLAPDEFRAAVCEAMGLTGDETDGAVLYQATCLRRCGEAVAARGTIVHCVDCADTGMFGEERCHCRGQEASHA